MKGDKSILDEQRELCVKLVGKWYLEDGSQSIEFDLLEKMFHQSRIVIHNKDQRPDETKFGIGVFPTIKEDLIPVFYIDIWMRPEVKYVINKITKEKLILQIHNYYEPTNKYCTYVRKIDVGFADKMLQGLHCI